MMNLLHLFSVLQMHLPLADRPGLQKIIFGLSGIFCLFGGIGIVAVTAMEGAWAYIYFGIMLTVFGGIFLKITVLDEKEE